MTFAERIGGLGAPGDHAPLYKQLQRALREAIHKKVLGPDDALPAERDLADEFKISRITVRKALDGLVSEGLLTRRQGAGTFVAARVEKSFSKLSSFTEDMISRGRVPRSEWISRSEGQVTPEESLTLGLSPGTPVYRFARIRYALSSIVSIRHVGSIKGSTPDAILARAQAQLDEGDVEAAVATLEALPDPAREVLAPWFAAANRRIEIDRQVGSVRADALAALSRLARSAP